jgi:hypothetical protein
MLSILLILQVALAQAASSRSDVGTQPEALLSRGFPSFRLPRISLPSLPRISLPSLPRISFPSLPNPVELIKWATKEVVGIINLHVPGPFKLSLGVSFPTSGNDWHKSSLIGGGTKESDMVALFGSRNHTTNANKTASFSVNTTLSIHDGSCYDDGIALRYRLGPNDTFELFWQFSDNEPILFFTGSGAGTLVGSLRGNQLW